MQAVDAGMAEDPDSSWGCSSWGRAHRRQYLKAPAPGRLAPVKAATESCCGGTNATGRRRLHPEGTSRSRHHRSEATAGGRQPEATAGRRQQPPQDLVGGVFSATAATSRRRHHCQGKF